jgi:hypothetical protein
MMAVCPIGRTLRDEEDLQEIIEDDLNREQPQMIQIWDGPMSATGHKPPLAQ